MKNVCAVKSPLKGPRSEDIFSNAPYTLGQLFAKKSAWMTFGKKITPATGSPGF